MAYRLKYVTQGHPPGGREKEDQRMLSKNLIISVSSPECGIDRYLHHHGVGLYPSSPKPRSWGISVVLAAAGKRTRRLDDDSVAMVSAEY